MCKTTRPPENQRGPADSRAESGASSEGKGTKSSKITRRECASKGKGETENYRTARKCWASRQNALCRVDKHWKNDESEDWVQTRSQSTTSKGPRVQEKEAVKHDRWREEIAGKESKRTHLDETDEARALRLKKDALRRKLRCFWWLSKKSFSKNVRNMISYSTVADFLMLHGKKKLTRNEKRERRKQCNDGGNIGRNIGVKKPTPSPFGRESIIVWLLLISFYLLRDHHTVIIILEDPHYGFTSLSSGGLCQNKKSPHPHLCLRVGPMRTPEGVYWRILWAICQR